MEVSSSGYAKDAAVEWGVLSDLQYGDNRFALEGEYKVLEDQLSEDCEVVVVYLYCYYGSQCPQELYFTDSLLVALPSGSSGEASVCLPPGLYSPYACGGGWYYQVSWSIPAYGVSGTASNSCGSATTGQQGSVSSFEVGSGHQHSQFYGLLKGAYGGSSYGNWSASIDESVLLVDGDDVGRVTASVVSDVAESGESGDLLLRSLMVDGEDEAVLRTDNHVLWASDRGSWLESGTVSVRSLMDVAESWHDLYWDGDGRLGYGDNRYDLVFFGKASSVGSSSGHFKFSAPDDGYIDMYLTAANDRDVEQLYMNNSVVWTAATAWYDMGGVKMYSEFWLIDPYSDSYLDLNCLYSTKNTGWTQDNYATCAIPVCPGETISIALKSSDGFPAYLQGASPASDGDTFMRLFDSGEEVVSGSTDITYTVPAQCEEGHSAILVEMTAHEGMFRTFNVCSA